MNKKRLWGGLAVGLALTLVLAGCGGKSSGDADKIVIGSQGSDAQIWKHIAQSQAAKDNGGVDLNNATK